MKKLDLHIKEKHIFFRFIMTYIMIFIISVIIISIFYFTTLTILKKNTINSAVSIMENTISTIDSCVADIDNAVNRIIEDYNVQAFLEVEKPLQNTDYANLRDLKENLPYNNTNSSIIEYLYVFFPKSDVIVSSEFASARMEELVYNNRLAYEGMSYAEWKEAVTDDVLFESYWAPRNISVLGNEISAITYIRSIYSLDLTEDSGIVIVLIEEEELAQKLDNSFIQNGGLSYINDENGNRIITANYSSIDDYELMDIEFGDSNVAQVDTTEGSMVVIKAVSELNGWQYVFAIPVEVIMEEINQITRTFIYVMASSFIFILMLAVVLAKRDSKPIQDIINLIAVNGEKNNINNGNEYDFIQGTIRNLINSNSNLKKDLDEQELLNRNIFFKRLLGNRFANINEMNNHIKHAKLCFNGSVSQIAIVRFLGYYGTITQEMLGDMGEARVVIMNILNEEIADLGYVHLVDETTIALVLSLDDSLNINSCINSIIKRFGQFNIKVCFGVGLPRESLILVWESFNEANWAMEKAEENNTTIVYYDTKWAELSNFYYPAEVEKKIMNLVKVGDKKEVKSILNTFYENNFTLQRLSCEKASMLIIELCSTLIRLINDIYKNEPILSKKTSSKIKAIIKNYPIEKDFKTITDIFIELCEYVASKKKNKNAQLQKDILDYIQNNYHDSELCLYSISSKFNLAEKYFSYFFKDQIGETFSSYLENIRMKKTSELLLSEKYTIKEIAQMTGYHNINTFYKAFKRVYGVSPRSFNKI